MDCWAAKQDWRPARSTAPVAFNGPARECAPYGAIQAGAEIWWMQGFAEGYRVGLHDRRYSGDRS